MDTDKHGCITVGVCAVYLTRIDHSKMFVRNLIFLPFDLDRGFTVERVQQFDLFVPVQRVITAGRCVICQLDAKFIYLLKCMQNSLFIDLF